MFDRPQFCYGEEIFCPAVCHGSMWQTFVNIITLCYTLHSITKCMEFHESGVFYSLFYKRWLVLNYSYPHLVINGKALFGDHSLLSVLVLAHKALTHQYSDPGPFLVAIGLRLEVFWVCTLVLSTFHRLSMRLISGFCLATLKHPPRSPLPWQYVWAHCLVGMSSDDWAE